MTMFQSGRFSRREKLFCHALKYPDNNAMLMQSLTNIQVNQILLITII